MHPMALHSNGSDLKVVHLNRCTSFKRDQAACSFAGSE
jgi:hypothetical protein